MNIYSWQKQNWLNLADRYQRNNLPHAMLFYGIPGLGKLDFASSFAQFLLCKNSQKSNIALLSESVDLNSFFNTCSCVACNLFRAGNHPDCFITQPEAENKALKVEQIRELINGLNCTAHQGGWQIAIINRAEAMNEAAANALLKTLEEPLGAKTLIILVSALASRLPATIISRCQALPFTAPSVESGNAWIKAELLAKKPQPEEISEEQINVALKLMHAAPLAASALLASDKLALRKKIIDEIFNFLAAGDKSDVVVCSEQLIKLDTNLDFLLELLQTVSADFIKHHLHLPLTSITNQDCAAAIETISHNFSLESLLSYTKNLLEIKKILGLNIALNKQLLIENLLLGFKECILSMKV